MGSERTHRKKAQMQSTRLVTSALVAAPSAIRITELISLSFDITFQTKSWADLIRTILRAFNFHSLCLAGTNDYFILHVQGHWKPWTGTRRKKYEMEYLMKGSSWALREIKNCWSWGFVEGIFINLITLKNCFLCMFFKQHWILIETETALEALHPLLLTEAVWSLHMILNKAGSMQHCYQCFDILLLVFIY